MVLPASGIEQERGDDYGVPLGDVGRRVSGRAAIGPCRVMHEDEHIQIAILRASTACTRAKQRHPVDPLSKTAH